MGNLTQNVTKTFHLLYLNSQELFGGYDGVSLLIECLMRDLTKFSSGLGHNRLLLAATDCTWLVYL